MIKRFYPGTRWCQIFASFEFRLARNSNDEWMFYSCCKYSMWTSHRMLKDDQFKENCIFVKNGLTGKFFL